MSEKHPEDSTEDFESLKDAVTVKELVDPTHPSETRREDPRVRLDTGKEHLTFRRKWWQLWYVALRLMLKV